MRVGRHLVPAIIAVLSPLAAVRSQTVVNYPPANGTGSYSDGLFIVLNVSGTITQSGSLGGAGLISKVGTGTLTLTNTDNSYAGGTEIAAGTLKVGSDAVLGNASGYVKLQNGVNSVLYVTDTMSTSRELRFGSGGGTINVDGSAMLTWNGSNIVGDQTLNKAGLGYLVVGGSGDTYSGTVNITAGILQLTAVDALYFSPINVNGGTLDISGVNHGHYAPITLNSGMIDSVSGGLNASGGIEAKSGNIYASLTDGTFINKTTSSTVTLRGTNTFYGEVSVADGTLTFADGSVISGSNSIRPTSMSGTLDLGGYSHQAGVGYSGGEGAVGTITNGIITPTGNQIYLEKGTFSATFAGSGGAARLWIGGDDTATVNLNGTNDMDYDDGGDRNGVIIGHALGGGATGTVKLGNANALATADNNIEVWGGTLDLNGNTNVRGASIRLLDGAACALINDAASTTASFAGSIGLMDFDNGGGANKIGGAGDLVLSGVVSDWDLPNHGPGRLEKIGAGKLTLEGDSTYTGATTVSAGTLVVNGSLVSNVTVASGAKLGGSGTVGAVTLSGIVSPGNSPGTLTTESETWNPDASYVWEIADADTNATPGAGWDMIFMMGSLDIQATNASKFTINIVSPGNGTLPAINFDPFTDADYMIAAATGDIDNFSVEKFLINTSAFFNQPHTDRFSIVMVDGVGDTLVLHYTAIPEPTEWGMMLGAALLGMILLRQHHLSRK